ncbi:hypothetical protein [Variovorax sp. KK3]|uniref:hypothetical protein n=1 Tax=Variovorax sp. KK3 TaxID=1855728 RepID=UPI00117F1E2C|nr:hypothetical protein [Variovorax sp. KK3]
MQSPHRNPTRSPSWFSRRPARRPSSLPRLMLGSLAAAAVMLAALALLGHWQAEASTTAPVRTSAFPGTTDNPSPVPAASDVLGQPTPVPDEPVATF